MKSEKLTIGEIKIWADENYDKSMLAQTIFEYWEGESMSSLKDCVSYDGDFEGFTRDSLLEFDETYKARWSKIDLTELEKGKWHKSKDLLK